MSSTSSKPKYHVALSFAGEDRDYVEKIAAQLTFDGVNVFYDKYEEVDLWGKDLYTHLQEVYEKRALFTVMFISEHYRDKLWTNHERKAAQARAFAESDKEYILPAFHRCQAIRRRGERSIRQRAGDVFELLAQHRHGFEQAEAITHDHSCLPPIPPSLSAEADEIIE